MGFYEAFDSRSKLLADNSRTTTTRRYMIDGTSDDAIAQSTAELNVPQTVGNLILDDIRLNRVGNQLWEAIGSYVDPDDESREDDKLDVGEIRLNFDTGGGSTTITQSEAGNTQRYAAAGVVAKDFRGAINVDKDTVNGVSVVVPALRIQLDVKYVNSDITAAFMKDVSRLTGKTNNAPVLGFDVGELLFLGGHGSQKIGDGNVTLHYDFEASENVQNLVFKDFQGNDITVASKGGHDFLWISYVPSEDVAAKSIVMRPHTAFVEKITKPGDFSILGIT